MQDYNDILAEILIDEETLQARIKELGAEISVDYPDGNLLLICILRGGVPFLVDLSRYITSPHMVDFMAVSSYGVGKARIERHRPRRRLICKPIFAIRMCCSSKTLSIAGTRLHPCWKCLQLRQPRSLKVCALLDKAERREAVVPIHYRGFDIPNKFVFGYRS